MAYVNKSGQLVYDRIIKPVVVHLHYQQGFKDNSRVDDLISLATYAQNLFKPQSKSTHSEIGFWVDGELWVATSTSRNRQGDGTVSNGTRWIRAAELMKDHPERWILQEELVSNYAKDYFPECREHFARQIIEGCIDRANKMIGLQYDFIGVGTDFINPLRWFKKQTVADIIKTDKVYCSKFCHLVRYGWSLAVSPRRWFRITSRESDRGKRRRLIRTRIGTRRCWCRIRCFSCRRWQK